MKIDMHTHTIYSGHCLTKLQDFRKICIKKNIFPIITDHNTIKGALKYKNLYKDCIVGEEISTKQGEIIGIFLNDKIPKDLDIIETVDLIKEQDGLIYLEHPFDRLRKRLDNYYLDKIKFDIIEIFNSRTLFDEDNLKAKKFAESNNYLKGVGSDSHSGFEIGRSYVVMENFNSKKEFLNNLKRARFFIKKSPFYVHLFTKGIKLIKSL